MGLRCGRCCRTRTNRNDDDVLMPIGRRNGRNTLTRLGRDVRKCLKKQLFLRFEGSVPGYEITALRIRLPDHDHRSGCAARLPRRRGQAAGRRPEPGADAGVPRRLAVAAGRSAQARRAAADQDRGRRRHARRHGALARHPRRRAAAHGASAAWSRPSSTSRIIRSATAAPSAAASRTPIPPPRCRASW